MNSCQQDQWKKVTGLFHYAASLRLVQDPKLSRLTLPGSWRALPLGKLVNFNWKKKEGWLGNGHSAPLPDQIPGSADVHGQVLLHCELWGQNHPNESLTLNFALRSGWFPTIKQQKKHFNFLFLFELFFQWLYFSPYWVLDYQMLMHIL